MNKFPSAMLAAALLSSAACSKPTSTSGGSGGPRPPGMGDAKAFVQSFLTPEMGLSVGDFKADAPVRQSGTAPDGNAWTVSVKVTLTPTEDLLESATVEQDHAFYAPVADLETLQAWRNVYVRSIYARTYGAFDLPALAAPARLLVIGQPKGKSLPAAYGKLAAQWQVDHWRWSNVDLQLPAVDRPRATFTDRPSLVLGTPEAEAVAAAQRKGMDEFRRRQADVQGRYAKDLAADTKPGTTYTGQIRHPNGVMPCEVRFVEPAAGKADAQIVWFEVRVPQDPTYLYVFKAKLSPEIPLNIPSGAAFHPTTPATNDADTDPPVGNLTATYVRGTGKIATYKNWPGVLLNGAINLSYGGTPLVLLGGHLRGRLGEFNGDYLLDAEQTH
ncbi:MAG: hypothetical protein INR62_00670 [Rhodospirillales bacterium]|nr:hypothetical protein [Acetobacter sp.]